MYDTAVPDNIRVAGDALMNWDNPIMMSAGIIPHKKAFVTIPYCPIIPENVKPIINADTAPKQAPDDIPVV